MFNLCWEETGGIIWPGSEEELGPTGWPVRSGDWLHKRRMSKYLNTSRIMEAEFFLPREKEVTKRVRVKTRMNPVMVE